MKREVQTRHKEKLFHPDDSPVMEQAAQRCCTVSVLGGFQDSARHNPQPTGLASDLRLLWAGDWTRNVMRSIPT